MARLQHGPAADRANQFLDYLEKFHPDILQMTLEEEITTFLKWCCEDTVSTTGYWPNDDEFWAYFHAAHVHKDGGPQA